MSKSKNIGVIQRKKKYPESYDEYLEAIYRISLNNPKGWVKNKDIADRLNVKPSSVSKMLAKLRDVGLIEWERRGGIRLSDIGRKRAKSIITNHIVLELFLDQTLHLKDREEIERVTCNLEHYLTRDLKNRLLSLMNIDENQIKNIDNLILEDKFPERIDVRPVYSEKQVLDIIKKIREDLSVTNAEIVKKNIDRALEQKTLEEFLS